ncbi:hypothetical protein [Streptococcus sp. E24BD]|uniref:hypothetical protein n=1 Tax=Streptococcus sp. E24BD TaxID=3278715 RepID=UPI00359D9508
MTQSDDKKLEALLKNGCILYMKNGIIKQVTPPEHGTVKLKSQNGVLVYKEVTAGEQL